MLEFLKNMLGKQQVVATTGNPMPDIVKEAARKLPTHIKKLDPIALEKIIAKQNQPNKWMITRICASGRIQKRPHIGGCDYNHPQNSPQMMAKRQRQIAKGIIQVSPDEEASQKKEK